MYIRTYICTNKYLYVVKIGFIIAHTRNNVVVLFGTLKGQFFMLTEVRDCDLLIVVYIYVYIHIYIYTYTYVYEYQYI